VLSQNIFGQKDSVYTGDNGNRDKKRPKEHRANLDAFKERLSYGGMIMPGFYASAYGNVFYITANPNIGYKLTKDLTVGLAANYSYTSVKSKYGTYKQSVYGPSVFARYKVLPNLFAQVQYNKLNQPDYYTPGNKRIWVEYFYVGGGYLQRFGDNAAMMYSILYNVSPSKNSIYYNPLIQIGFVVGI
jgi:hypothetical protein